MTNYNNLRLKILKSFKQSASHLKSFSILKQLQHIPSTHSQTHIKHSHYKPFPSWGHFPSSFPASRPFWERKTKDRATYWIRNGILKILPRPKRVEEEKRSHVGRPANKDLHGPFFHYFPHSYMDVFRTHTQTGMEIWNSYKFCWLWAWVKLVG